MAATMTRPPRLTTTRSAIFCRRGIFNGPDEDKQVSKVYEPPKKRFHLQIRGMANVISNMSARILQIADTYTSGLFSVHIADGPPLDEGRHCMMAYNSNGTQNAQMNPA